jgi:hypothetical protein
MFYDTFCMHETHDNTYYISVMGSLMTLFVLALSVLIYLKTSFVKFDQVVRKNINTCIIKLMMLGSL